MNMTLVGLIGLVALLVLIFLRIPVGFAMGIVGFVGLWILKGSSQAAMVVGLEPYSQVAVYTFSCVPLFVFMGTLIANTGIGKELFDFAASWLGHIRGGLGMAATTACGVFAAICGHSQATAVTMSKVSYPQLVAHGYDKGIACGSLAAGGSIGVMIPPSMGFILYGMLTQESIGKLFMAGLLPGILQVVLFCIVFFLLGMLAPKKVPSAPKSTWKERFVTLAKCWPFFVLIIVVLGGIYAGIFTTTEAGAIGAFGAVIVAAIDRRLTLSNIIESMRDAVQTCGMIIMMLVGAHIFMRFLTAADIPNTINMFISALNIPRGLLLLVIVLIYMVLGCVFDIFAAILITVPIFYPVMVSLGFSGIWFGVLVVGLMELAEITPPIGMNVFVLSNACKLPVGTIFKGVIWFILADVVFIAILCFWPEFTLLLQ